MTDTTGEQTTPQIVQAMITTAMSLRVDQEIIDKFRRTWLTAADIHPDTAGSQEPTADGA